MKLRRKLGQHFLKNQSVLEKMVEYARISRSDVVLEVGAGRGDLTEKLARSAGKVIAVELDERLVRELEKRLKRYPNVEVLVGDILKLKPSGFNKVVSNPPYSISSRLLEWLMESGPELMVLTLQKEFASKLVAKPGSAKYLYLSFLSSTFYEVETKEIVPREMFEPPPKVDSVVIFMKKKPGEVPLTGPSKKLIRYLFTRRRQTLRRVLKDLAVAVRGPVDLSNLPGEILSKRIYQLSPGELLRLVEAVGEA